MLLELPNVSKSWQSGLKLQGQTSLRYQPTDLWFPLQLEDKASATQNGNDAHDAGWILRAPRGGQLFLCK